MEENINLVKFTKITWGHWSRRRKVQNSSQYREKDKLLLWYLSSLDVPFPFKLTNTKIPFSFALFFSETNSLYFIWHFMFMWHYVGVLSRNVAPLWSHLQQANWIKKVVAKFLITIFLVMLPNAPSMPFEEVTPFVHPNSSITGILFLFFSLLRYLQFNLI